jgi:hypothetical protein
LSDLVARALAAVLHDAVPHPHVVQQEIAVGVDDDVTEGRGHGVLIVEHGPRFRGSAL